MRKKRQAKKRVPDPPGSTLSTEESLHFLRRSCHFSNDVEIWVPEPEARADEPPAGFFTVYESFFRDCFLWFPIPLVILEYLSELELSISQLTPRSVRHLVGILVRSYECEEEVTAFHLLNLLELRRSSPKDKFVYYASNKKNRRIITGFPNKDHRWIDHFFYVPICEATLGDGVGLIKTKWERMVPHPFAKCPSDVFSLSQTLGSRKCSWEKNFSLHRVEKARALHAGSSVSSFSASSSEEDILSTMENMKKKLSFRERAALVKKQAEEKKQQAALDAKRSEKKKKKSAPETKEKIPTASQDARSQTGSEPSLRLPAPSAVESPKKGDPEDCALALVPADKRGAKAKLRAEAAGKEKTGTTVPGRDEAKSSKRKAASPVEGHPAKRISQHSVEPTLQSGADTPARDPNDPYVEATVSARIVSNFCRPGQAPLAPSSLKFPDGYSEIALRTVKLAAHVNQLVADYEGEIDLSKLRYEDARRIAVEADAKVEKVEQEKANLKTKLKLAGEQIQVLEHSKKKKDQAIENVTKDWEEATAKLEEADLKLGEVNQKLAEANQKLAEANAVKETEIFDAVVTAKRDIAKKFHLKIAKARKCFEEIDGEALVNMRDLFEMKSNLLLLSTLQEENAPTLEEEAKTVRENAESLKGADDHFDRLLLELKEALAVDTADDLAASIGVGEPSGSNHDAPGIDEFVSKELADPTVAEPLAASSDFADKGAPEETMAEFIKSVQAEEAAGFSVMVNYDDQGNVLDDGEGRPDEAEAKEAAS